MRPCAKCGETKPLDQFNRRSNGRGRRSDCKACQSIYNAAWRNEPVRNALLRAYDQARSGTSEGWAKKALRRCIERAKKRGVPCTITWQRLLELHERSPICPALGIKLKYGVGRLADNSASVDCINAALGYVPGNCIILSNLANQIKTSATGDQIVAVGAFVTRVEAASRARIAALAVAQQETIL